MDVEERLKAFVVQDLPQKGTLYLSSTMDESAKIDQPYQSSRIINRREQFVWDVKSVSSFWGGPPHSGYHALNLIGGHVRAWRIHNRMP